MSTTSTTQSPTPGQPIPTPPDFPVVWDDPRDAKLTWMLIDRPKTPISLLAHAVVGAFMMGSVPDFQRAGLPISLRIMRINTYLYFAMAPKAPPPEVVMKGMGLLNRTAPGVFKMMMGKMVGRKKKKTEAFLNPIVERFES